MNYFLLIRHAKAKKNVDLTHGGMGSSILESEIKNIKVVSDMILATNVKFDIIHYSPRLQCEETAKYLSEFTKIPFTQNENIQPINLGIIDGMSEFDVEMKFPIINQVIKRWRAGEIEINELKIPEMENCYEYFAKGKVQIEKLARSKKNIIMVCTRSSLVLYANIFMNRSPQVGKGYKEIAWRNCDFAIFQTDGKQYMFQKALSNFTF